MMTCVEVVLTCLVGMSLLHLGSASHPNQCAAGTWSPPGSTRCASGWTETDGAGCLMYRGHKLSWWSARDECVALGGYLAVPTSGSEYDAINRFRWDNDGVGGDGYDTWGGISWNWDASAWYNVLGDKQMFFRWDGGQPSGGEYCVQFRDHAEMNDEDCHRDFRYVCQRPLSCSACAAGKHSDGTSGCSPCPAGHYSAGGASECSPCAAGTYSASAGSSACSPCAPGSYSASGSSSCIHCPSNSNSPSASPSAGDCSCNAGFSGPQGGPCSACPAGTYKHLEGSQACAPCDFEPATSSLNCTGCPAGYSLMPSPGAATLKACQCGHCAVCEEGTFKSENGTAPCIPCDMGNYSFHGASSCFSLSVHTAGEWQIVSTSAGLGSSQSIQLKVGISRSEGIEQKQAWASSVVHGVRSTAATISTDYAEYEKTSEAGVSGGFSILGLFSFGASAGYSSTTTTGNSVTTVTAADQSIVQELAQVHADTISAALEENMESTITQSFGNAALSGAGVVWQFEYKIVHIFGSNVIGTQNIVLTDNVAKTPCCLPGTFKDHSKPHGPCLPGYPCACSPSICYPDAPAGVNNISFDETGAPFLSIGACDSSTASVVKIERIVNENQIRNDVHVDVNDLLLKDSAFKYQLLKDEQSKIITKLDKLSKKVSELNQSCGIWTNGNSAVSPSTPGWDPSMSPTWLPGTSSVPPWNQLQYKFCQPVFDSWADMRRRADEGSLVIKTGGLGKLMVLGKYESWVCVRDDACALAGDYFFCYVFDEDTNLFVPWDQNFNLNLFRAKSQATPASASTTLEELQSQNRLLQELLRQLMTK